MSDAFALTKNNYIEIETALDLTKYIAEEDEILVWFEVLLNLINREVIYDVNNYALYPLLKARKECLTNPVFIIPCSEVFTKEI